jgi:thioesterase domain-containing protein/acyl carrier protein
VAFVADPFTATPDARVYRTGDLVRRRASGALEFLGRIDSQVKVRGFRVETQEIEALLSTHPDIEETIVDALVDEQGETRLVAYAVPVQGRSIGAARIRGFLSDVLPHYMVPSSVVTVDAFPRTPSGKVDRRALGAMRREGAPARPAPPSIDPTERRLIGIWAQILGLLAITATDNFFELGGNSLMAAQMMLLIQRTFGRQLPPSALFRAPTVHQLAEMLRTDQHEDTSVPSLVSIQPEGSLTPFFWIHGDRSNAYLPEFLGDDRPLYGLMHQGLDGLPVAHTRVETIAAHYVRQMQTVQPAGPYLLGGYSFGGTVAFEIAQQLRAQGHDVPLLAMLDSLYPGDDAHLTALDERTSISGASAGASISRHSRFDTLAQLGFRERLTYLRAGATARLTAMIARPGVKRAIVATCLRLKRRLPAFVRSFYILGIYRAALASYAPKPYAGRVVYFKSSSRSHAHQEKWRAVVPGGLEAYEVPGEHTTIIRHENARPWAERLRKCVAETVASCAFL